MPQYSRLSIWNESPNHMSWYDYCVGRTLSEAQANNSVPKIEVDEYECTWYNILKAQDLEERRAEIQAEKYRVQRTKCEQHTVAQREGASGAMRSESDSYDAQTLSKLRSSSRAEQASGSRLSRRDLYFEYMFVNAELEYKNASQSDNDSDLTKEEANNAHGSTADPPAMGVVSHFSPRGRHQITAATRKQSPSVLHGLAATIEYSPITLHHDKVDPRTWYSASSVSLSTSSAYPVATPDYSPDSPWTAEDPPTPIYSPISPYSDSASPDSPPTSFVPQYSPSSPFYDTSSSVSKSSSSHSNRPVTRLEVIDEEPEDTDAHASGAGLRLQRTPPPRPVLQPKSQKAKAIRKLAAGIQDVVSALSSYSSFCKLEVKQASRISRAPSVEFVKVVKKRPARGSFADKNAEIVIIDDDTDQEVQYLCTKKARHSRHEDLDKVEIESAFTPVHIPDDKHSTRVVSDDFFEHQSLPTPPKGYPGQFEGIVVKAVNPSRSHNPIPKSTSCRDFGAKGHPNGTFTHTAFVEDPFGPVFDFSQKTIPEEHPLRAYMSFADDMMISATDPKTVRLRTRDQEILRREVHLECASARLEGISIGYWRYHQGAYSLEEYKQANLCICWDVCRCAKMCTRYGDLKCPCRKDVIVHSDDD